MSKYTKSRAARTALQGATVVTSGLFLLGLAGTASAHTASPQGCCTQPDEQDTQQSQIEDQGDNDSLVDVSHNLVPVEVDQVQAPIDALTGDQEAPENAEL